MKKILFAASECVPFIKTGGLADVCGALPKQFDPEEYDIRVVIPNYECIKPEFRNKFQYETHFYMSCGEWIQNKYVGVLSYVYEGIKYYFIDNQEYFSGPTPYSDTRWDMEKYIFFDKAVLSMLPLIGFQPDIIHCHDWQTGYIPVYLNTEFQGDMFFWGMKSIFTIHNLKFQGQWDIRTAICLSGLSADLFTADKLECNEGSNMLKGGLVYSDYISTVSDTYAEEIQTAWYGEGLDGLLKARKDSLCGIVNGIDYDLYDPSKDENIFVQYDAENWRKKKVQNKVKLQEELGLTVDKSKYLIGLVSRLTDQKGLDLIDYAFNSIVDENTQFVVIGTGEPRYENMFKYYAGLYPDRVSANICYNNTLAQKLYAAADAFLMPSAFEPCGLTQMMAFRYGTVPVVRETGGLKDTVAPYNEYDNSGTGFSFANYNGDEMLNTINYSKKVFFESKRKFNQIVDRGMTADFSWKVSAGKYAEVYEKVIGLK